MKDLKKIESKWQKEWKKSKIFEAEPNKKKKFFTSLVIAYPSGDLHIGHARTFTRSDIIARFKRMLGYNVLCTTGFHATGNRAVVMAKRIADKDKKTIQTLKDLYNLSDKEIKSFANKPDKIVRFFMEKGTETLNLGGFALDLRRRFISIDPHFSKFIEWQLRTLKKKGYVSKGSHPVIYCPKCESPITQSDRDEGENAIVNEISIWKYKLDNGVILPAATLRPETIFAITNVFLHPDAKYVLVKIGKETWIVSDTAAKKLKQQKPDLEILDEIDPVNVIGQKIINPVTKEKMLVLPGPFINPDATTGVVASEPSDAPDDHIALKELKKSSQLARYNLSAKDIEKIKYKSLIKVEGYGDFPALELCEKMKITSLSDDEKLLEAKKLLYKLQFHKGVMKKLAGKFAGMSVSDAIEAVKKEYKSILDVMYEPSERVTCKCGAECYIKLLQDQWFINYGNNKWKSQVKKHLKEMNIYPDFWRQAFDAALDWVADKACVRRSGLGTPLPWDKDWVIETLSDSTIYMVFFIIDKFIKPNKIKAEQLTDDFFDYVLLSKGNCKTVSKKVLNDIKKDFEYWYPLDWRNSAKDLLNNHLLYFIYNHIAIFPKKNWPKTISINGYVNLEGEKMSKSKGRAMTFRTAIKTYGADVTRTVSVTATSPEQDSDWRNEDADNMVKWRNKFYELINKISKTKKFVKENNSDKWLLSRSMSVIDKVTSNLETLSTRDAAQYCFYQMMSDFRWYLRRNNDQLSKTAKEIAINWVKLIAPFMPHIAEELWKDLSQKGFVSNASWPKIDKKKIDKKAENSETLIQKSLDDVQHIIKIIGKKPKEVYLYVIPNELKLYKESINFFAKVFDAKVFVYAVNDKNKVDPEKKASKAKPGKPGIYIK